MHNTERLMYILIEREEANEGKIHEIKNQARW